MKRLTANILTLALLVMAGYGLAVDPELKDPGCPAAQAGQSGFALMKELHSIMAPAWHTAYPDKDYAAIGEAVDKFGAMIPKVKELQHQFKIAARQEKFNAARQTFLRLLDEQKKAKTINDNQAMYAIMPDLHKSFEEMAFYLLPVRFTEYGSLKSIVSQMTDAMAKNKNVDAVKSQMDTLRVRNGELRKAALPEDLAGMEKDVKAAIGNLDQKCAELYEACQGNDAATIEACLMKLKAACDEFENKYL